MDGGPTLGSRTFRCLPGRKILVGEYCSIAFLRPYAKTGGQFQVITPGGETTFSLLQGHKVLATFGVYLSIDSRDEGVRIVLDADPRIEIMRAEHAPPAWQKAMRQYVEHVRSRSRMFISWVRECKAAWDDLGAT